MPLSNRQLIVCALACALLATACGGGGGTPATYSVGGSVTALSGSGLVLQNNGGNDLPVSASGTFTIATAVQTGTAYAVTVRTQPAAPAQTCTVANGSGTVASANVTNVTISCVNEYKVGGTINGLSGSGLVLQVNSGSDLSLSANGSFNFPAPEAAGAAYAVTVKTQPAMPAQVCAVTNSSGTIGSADVTNIEVVCTNVGRFVYVANKSLQSISAYAIDPDSGALTEIAGSPFPSRGSQPSYIAVSPSKKFLYCVNLGGTGIFAIDASSGALTEISGSPLINPLGPEALAIDSAGKFAYETDTTGGKVSVYAIDSTSGALTQVSGSPFNTAAAPISVALTPAGTFAYVTSIGANNVSGFAIDSGSAALTPVAGSPFPTGTYPFWIAIEPAGKFAYVTNSGPNTVSGYAIDPVTGSLTALAGSPFAGQGSPEFVAAHPSGKFVYVSNISNSSISGYTLDPASGALSPLTGSPFAAGTFPKGLAIDPAGKFVYAANSGSASVSAYVVDPASGVLTPVSGSPFKLADNNEFVAID